MKQRKFFVLTASFLMAVLALSRSGVLTVFADGCSSTGVDMSGATCSQSGSTPGTDGSSGGGSGDGQPGDSGSNNDNNNNNNNGNGTGGSCSPGTYVSTNVAFPAGSSGITIPGANFDPYDVPYSLPDGSVVNSSGIPSN